MTMHKKIIIFCILSVMPAYLIAAGWRSLGAGIEYINIPYQFLSPWSQIHVIRINLNYNFFSIITARELSQKSAEIVEYIRKTDGLIAINGGFFDKAYKPLGLRISERQYKVQKKPISWWGIFYIINNKPKIINMKDFKEDRQIDFAIQAGPRLLINRKIPALKSGIAERSALGITKNNEIIVIVTENAPMSTITLAGIMRSSPLNCYDALNLDGGSSSQLYAKIDDFRLHVQGFSSISDAIVVRALPP